MRFVRLPTFTDLVQFEEGFSLEDYSVELNAVNLPSQVVPDPENPDGAIILHGSGQYYRVPRNNWFGLVDNNYYEVYTPQTMANMDFVPYESSED